MIEKRITETDCSDADVDRGNGGTAISQLNLNVIIYYYCFINFIM